MPNLAKANLLARKTRSLITIFGIALSVALLLVLVGLVNGTVRDTANRILNIGADIMVGSAEIGVFYPATVGSDKYIERIRPVEGVEKVTPVLIESAPTINKSKQLNNYVYGIDYDDYVGLGQGFKFVAGGRLEKPDDIIIDTEVADLNKVKVGDTLSLLNHDWRVVGIVKEALGARFYTDRHNLVSVVYPERPTNQCTIFYVKVKPGVEVEEVSERLRTLLGEDWSVRNVKELFDLFISGAVGLKEFMVAVIGVCAIICFFVILLSMYTAIIERTREIGILKSLGATKRFIIFEIMKEALIIAIFGIVSGYLLTLAATQMIVGLFPTLEVEMSLEWMINAAAISIIATAVGTLYPSWRASRLDPVEALSWE